jgi:hypothetical protein
LPWISWPSMMTSAALILTPTSAWSLNRRSGGDAEGRIQRYSLALLNVGYCDTTFNNVDSESGLEE